MLNGDSALLTHREQVIVGAWITKTSILMTLADLPPGSESRELARKVIFDMMLSGLPPAMTSVRLGFIDLDSTIPTEDAAEDVSHLLPADTPQPAYFSVSSIGHLAWEMAMGYISPLIRFIDSTPDNDWLIRVWPPNVTQALWPPRAALPERDFLGMRNAWVSVSAPGVHPAKVHNWPTPYRVDVDPARAHGRHGDGLVGPLS